MEPEKSMKPEEYRGGYASVPKTYGARRPAKYGTNKAVNTGFRDQEQHWLPGVERGTQLLQPSEQETRGPGGPSRQSSFTRSPGAPGTGALQLHPQRQPLSPQDWSSNLTSVELQLNSDSGDVLNRHHSANVDQSRNVVVGLSRAAAPTIGVETGSYAAFTGAPPVPQHMTALGLSPHIPWQSIEPHFNEHGGAHTASDVALNSADHQRGPQFVEIPGQGTFGLEWGMPYQVSALPAQSQPVVGEASTIGVYDVETERPVAHDVRTQNWHGVYGQTETHSFRGREQGEDPARFGGVADSGLEPGLSRINFGRQSAVPDEPCLVPPPPEQARAAQSPDTPLAEVTSMPAILQCPREDCDSIFKGDYRRGNLARHIRVQHGGQQGAPRSFPCEEPGCNSTFRRKDARLKHYRKTHPERLETPPLRRKPLPGSRDTQQQEE